jgi:hypothetical protein
MWFPADVFTVPTQLAADAPPRAWAARAARLRAALRSRSSTSLSFLAPDRSAA